MTGSRRNLISLVLALILVAACFVGSPSEQNPAAPGAQEDGSMTVQEFEQDINAAVGTVEQYWTSKFAESGQRFVPIKRIIPYLHGGEVACGQADIPDNNAVYCSAGDFIAYDTDWAVAAFQKIGDAFLFYLLGHEYAHGVQIRLGIEYNFTIQQELQADCMAGAYIGDSVRSETLLLAQGDIEEFRRGLLAVGDDPGQPWFAPNAHGTAEQRTAAFFGGYEKSLAACGFG